MGGVKMGVGVLVTVCAVVLGVVGCGDHELSATTQSAAALWELSERAVFKEGRPANTFVATLLESLAATSGQGKPVSEGEFRELLGRLSPEVYPENIIKYATPQSVTIQNREHTDYRKVFLKPRRIAEGARFIARHRAELDSAQARYRVEVRDIVSILMWESGLGEFVGSHYIVNVFLGQILYLDQARDLAVRELIIKGEADTTALKLGEAEKKRLDRLRRSAALNLAALLRMSKEKGVEAAELRGSWGGAIGYVQFMPSSMQFARDGDSDGRIDLCTWPDAIHSVANYLHANGYGASGRGRRRAIHAYNPIDSYVNGVIEYADAVWKKYQEDTLQR